MTEKKETMKEEEEKKSQEKKEKDNYSFYIFETSAQLRRLYWYPMGTVAKLRLAQLEAREMGNDRNG